MRKKITVISATSDTTGRSCSDFTVMSMIIESSGSIIMHGCVYDNYLMSSSLSELLSRIPFIRKASEFTHTQKVFGIVDYCLHDADEVICGAYKRDVALVNKMYRSFKNTSINPYGGCLNILTDVRELFKDVQEEGNSKVTHKQVIKAFNVNIDDARDVACGVFDVEYWSDIPTSAIKASIYLLARLSEMGYSSEEVADSILEYMHYYNTSEYAVQCKLGGGGFGTSEERVTYYV